ncbi:hypothetical protein CSUI_002991 [Cystoisospora suis]|uniref:Uncharacterized protein n=1 Tax=Cystoisospora suis TaxID=483139 RepID=A0A2C6L600_9APIC|nr:hypothetical protein CSUI_002991 [Cystoisospora suis]
MLALEKVLVTSWVYRQERSSFAVSLPADGFSAKAISISKVLTEDRELEHEREDYLSFLSPSILSPRRFRNRKTDTSSITGVAFHPNADPKEEAFHSSSSRSSWPPSLTCSSSFCSAASTEESSCLGRGSEREEEETQQTETECGKRRGRRESSRQMKEHHEVYFLHECVKRSHLFLYCFTHLQALRVHIRAVTPSFVDLVSSSCPYLMDIILHTRNPLTSNLVLSLCRKLPLLYILEICTPKTGTRRKCISSVSSCSSVTMSTSSISNIPPSSFSSFQDVSSCCSSSCRSPWPIFSPHSSSLQSVPFTPSSSSICSSHVLKPASPIRRENEFFVSSKASPSSTIFLKKSNTDGKDFVDGKCRLSKDSAKDPEKPKSLLQPIYAVTGRSRSRVCDEDGAEKERWTGRRAQMVRAEEGLSTTSSRPSSPTPKEQRQEKKTTITGKLSQAAPVAEEVREDRKEERNTVSRLACPRRDRESGRDERKAADLYGRGYSGALSLGENETFVLRTRGGEYYGCRCCRRTLHRIWRGEEKKGRKKLTEAEAGRENRSLQDSRLAERRTRQCARDHPYDSSTVLGTPFHLTSEHPDAFVSRSSDSSSLLPREERRPCQCSRGLSGGVPTFPSLCGHTERKKKQLRRSDIRSYLSLWTEVIDLSSLSTWRLNA